MRPITALITTGTNGAKARLTTDRTIVCCSIFVVPSFLNSAGTCYIGTSDLDATTGAGVIYPMPGSDAGFSLPPTQSAINSLQLADYWVAGTNTGDVILLTYWIA